MNYPNTCFKLSSINCYFMIFNNVKNVSLKNENHSQRWLLYSAFTSKIKIETEIYEGKRHNVKCIRNLLCCTFYVKSRIFFRLNASRYVFISYKLRVFHVIIMVNHFSIYLPICRRGFSNIIYRLCKFLFIVCIGL